MKVSTQGRIAHGALGYGIYIDNTKLAVGGGTCWYDQRTIVFQYGGTQVVAPPPPGTGGGGGTPTPPTPPGPGGGGGSVTGSAGCQLGVSWFWLLAGIKYWPAQVASNLNWIAQKLSPNYARVLCVVGGKTFVGNDGQFYDPWQYCGAYLNWPDYDTILQRAVDMLFDRGIKTELTFTGTIQQTPNPADQEALVQRIARNMAGRMQKLQLIEMANEYSVNDMDVTILRRMATVAAPLFPGIPLSLSSPTFCHSGGPTCGTAAQIQGEVTAMYGGFPAATAITPHWCRDTNHNAPPLGPTPPCPSLKYSNEPRGPGASGGTGDVRDTATIVGDYQKAINAGYAGYVFHTDWGIWADHLHPQFFKDGNGEWADMEDVPNAEATVTALKTLKNQQAGTGAGTGGNPADLLPDLNIERAKYGAMIDANTAGAIINAVAWKNKGIGWGCNFKSGDPNINHAVRSDGSTIAVDILHHKPSDHIVDCFEAGPDSAYGEEGIAKVHWNDYLVNPNLSRPWVAAIAPYTPTPNMLSVQATVQREGDSPVITPFVTIIPPNTPAQLGYYNIDTVEFYSASDNSATIIYGSGNGHWAAWVDGRGLYSSASVGLTKPLASLLAVGPDGSVAYRPTLTGNGFRVWQPKGNLDYEVTNQGYASDVVIADEGQILWREGTTLKTKNLPTAVVLGGVSSPPKLALVKGKWWIGYQSTTHGMVLHPLDSTVGFLMPVSTFFDISPLQANPSIIRWAYSNDYTEVSVSHIDINVDTAAPTLGPGIVTPGVPPPPTVTNTEEIMLTSTGTFDVIAAVEEVVTLPIQIYPSYPSPTGHGRIIHPVLGSFDYEVKPDEWVNIDADAIIPPVWASSRTLTSTANVLWNGNLRDVVVEERWKALGGLAMPATQLRMLLAVWTTPIDPDVGYVQWCPNYITGVKFKVLPINLTAGGQGITFDDVVNYKDENGEDIGWMTQPVTFQLKIVERVE